MWVFSNLLTTTTSLLEDHVQDVVVFTPKRLCRAISVDPLPVEQKANLLKTHTHILTVCIDQFLHRSGGLHPEAQFLTILGHCPKNDVGLFGFGLWRWPISFVADRRSGRALLRRRRHRHATGDVLLLPPPPPGLFGVSKEIREALALFLWWWWRWLTSVTLLIRCRGRVHFFLFGSCACVFFVGSVTCALANTTPQDRGGKSPTKEKYA